MSREDPPRERHARRRAWPLAVAVIAAALAAVGAITVIVVLSRTDFQLPSAVRDPEGPANGVLVSTSTDDGMVTWTLGAPDRTRVIVPPPDPPEFDGLPRFSPDGTKIAFLRVVSETDSASLMVVNADGTNLRAIVGPESGLRRFDWSPSGREIAYTADTDDGWAVFVVGLGPLDHPRSVSAFPGNAFLSDVLWHPAGDQIIVHIPQGEVVTVGRDGGQAVKLVRAPHDVGHVDVSPDGRVLAYTMAGGVHRLDLLTQVREGRSGESVERSVEFSPDGAWLATTRAVEGGIRIFLRPPEATPDEAIGIGPVIEEEFWSLFSPDGTTMIVGPYSDETKAWVIDVGSGQFEPLVWSGTPPADWQPVWR